VHDSRGIKIVNFTISLALSAGTLMASAGTPYRLVPAHFYPWHWVYMSISVGRPIFVTQPNLTHGITCISDPSLRYPKLQEALLPQTDRATRCVSQNLPTAG